MMKSLPHKMVLVQVGKKMYELKLRHTVKSFEELKTILDNNKVYHLKEGDE